MPVARPVCSLCPAFSAFVAVLIGAPGCQSSAPSHPGGFALAGSAGAPALTTAGTAGSAGALLTDAGAGAPALIDAGDSAGKAGGSVDAGPDAAPLSDAAPPVEPGWTFVWSDEFTGPDVDTSIWTIVDTPGTSANKELQYYTNRKNQEPGANVFIADDALVIEAREEAMNGYAYTSARLNTLKSAAQFTYGRMEARAKLPNVTGMWPAFWMLGINSASVGWPIGGEIDIMEGKGRLPNWVSGALHRSLTRGANGDIVSVQSYQLATGNFHDDWHVFAVEWDNQQIRWYVDDALFQTVMRPTSTGQPWPFDQPFYFLLNLAVGGVFDTEVAPPPGMAPQRLYVDYVRV